MELKPCPFCKSTKIKVVVQDETNYRSVKRKTRIYVQCSECKNRSEGHFIYTIVCKPNPDKMAREIGREVDKWNRRSE